MNKRKRHSELGEVEIALDTIKTIQEIHERALSSNWIPGTPSMTEEDQLEVIRQLKRESEIEVQTARSIIGKEYCDWIDSIELKWTNQVPYSMQPGWTNGNFSIIYDKYSTESLLSAKNRYGMLFK